MGRPMTLFTGQWADLPLAELAPLAKKMGYRLHPPLRAAHLQRQDSRMDRVHGATESAAFCRRLDFPPAHGAFDAAFDKQRPGGGMAGR